ncbi:SDR family NAD(P)-dependent oxidoreductase [uncultured Umboniibacter sp.]|uniref:SDR family NAD(P)-dependent oxidoreductase n=1 Tax=uncultured Umboniibacter sp. TaxID=1798917 RepID=UPI00260F2F45|nr:SDR family NAD(P)-dependent oxidoreductase [uncultured Umboniibacter sp.]
MTKPIAVITGAASGIGEALAEQLVSSHRLILVDINREALSALSTRLAGSEALVADLTSTSEIEALLNKLNLLTGNLALLINSAGITHRSLACETELEVVKRVMQVDYFAPVQLVSGLFERLNQDATLIVNLGSMAGWMPVAGRAGYCAAKSALTQYFETLRAESSHLGLSILMVYPTFVATPIEHNALDGAGGMTNKPRSTAGNVQTLDSVVTKIMRAIHRRDERLYFDIFTSFAKVLYWLFPRVYQRLMRRKFSEEISG